VIYEDYVKGNFVTFSGYIFRPKSTLIADRRAT